MTSFVIQDDMPHIVIDQSKGRCLAASRSYEAGDTVLIENALVFGTYEEDGSFECNMELLNYSLSHVFEASQSIDYIVGSLTDLSKVQSEDIALCFLQLLGLARMEQEQSHNISESLKRSYDLLHQLTAAHLDDCIKDIKSFREENPTIIPSSITNEYAGKLLGILNTNEFELESISGTGLFPFAAILEHNCSPNCSFTTDGSTLFLAATQSISIGERLSIDYGNLYYHPIETRREQLYHSYQFQCMCSKCTNPIDSTRPFYCEYCSLGNRENDESCVGLVYPSTVTDVWTCTICEQPITTQRKQKLLEEEQAIISSPPSTLLDIQNIVMSKTLHENHYLLFWSVKDLIDELTEQASFTKSIQTYQQAYFLQEKIISLLEHRLPPIHHEKVIFYDRLAQLAVACNNYDAAVAMFRSAYEMSCLACGRDVPCTLSLLALATNTPRTMDELTQHYRRGRLSTT